MSNDKGVEKWKQKAASHTPRVKPHNVFFNPEGDPKEDIPTNQVETTIEEVINENPTTPSTYDKSTVQKDDKNTQEKSVLRMKTNIENKTINEQIRSTHVNDTENVHISTTQISDTEKKNPVEAFLEITKQKETVEDTHTRKTFIVKNDLLKRFEKLQRKHGRGFQTWFINQAIERLLTEIEENKK